MKEIDKINEELRDLSPNLAKLKKEARYKDLDNYFMQMQQDIFAKLKEEQDNFSREMPQDYFINLPDTVISTAKEKKLKIVSLKPILKWSAAASVLLIVGISALFFLNNSEMNKNALTLESEEDLKFILDQYSTDEDFEFIKENIDNEFEVQTNEEMENIFEDEDIEILNEII
jgi:hypothetical protein